MNHWMPTFTGKKFWPMKPRPEDVDIVDIAHALAHVCRYNGHCRHFYSVAQHSVLVSRYVPEALAMQGLLHDAAEAYMPDIVQPLKVQMSHVRGIERRLLVAIGKALKVPALSISAESPAIKRVDTKLLMTEARDLMNEPSEPWGAVDVDPYPEAIIPVGPDFAEQLFLNRFYEIKGVLEI